MTVQFETVCVHGGVEAEPVTGAMLTPLVQSTAFKQHSVERYAESGYTYSRAANPTVRALETKVAEMEGAKQPGVCFASGMAAFNTMFASLLESGDHVVMPLCSYGGSNRSARVLWARQFGVRLSFVDFTDPSAVAAAIEPEHTRVVLSETPCNPVLQLVDLAAIGAICREASHKVSTTTTEQSTRESLVESDDPGAGPSRRGLAGRVIHVADTTLAPPPVLQGLTAGADVLLLSLTKYYCGHNMHLGGALVTSDPDLYALFRFNQNVMGAIMSPNTAYSMLQTATTMSLRVVKQSQNAQAVAEFLSTHPRVSWVRYPGFHHRSACYCKPHCPTPCSAPCNCLGAANSPSDAASGEPSPAGTNSCVCAGKCGGAASATNATNATNEPPSSANSTSSSPCLCRKLCALDRSQLQIARRQHNRGINGALLAFEVKGGCDAGRRCMNACKAPLTLAENLGAIQSIITCPSVFTHGNMTREAREKAGITDGLIRFSVGIEDIKDIIAALSAALDACPAV